MNASLATIDPEIADIIEQEKNRQVKTLQLIASEVCTHKKCVAFFHAHNKNIFLYF